MVRLMVTSSAYRQSSLPRPELDAIDPDNRLVARQSRFRLEAEQIRDNALAVSGLLVKKLGGDIVRPYQPAKYYAALNFPGARVHSRRRTTTSSAGPCTSTGSGSSCTRGCWRSTRRRARNARPSGRFPTRPRAALVLLNDPSFVEAARALAAKVLAEAPADDDAANSLGLAAGARAATPKPTEAERAREAARTSIAQHYAADAQGGRGARRRSAFRRGPKDANAAELAAWTSVSRVLLEPERNDYAQLSNDRQSQTRSRQRRLVMVSVNVSNVMTMHELQSTLEQLARRDVSRPGVARARLGGAGRAAAAAVCWRGAAGAQAPQRPYRGVVNPLHFAPKAKRVIFLCMAGGPSHLETFDYKPKLAEMHGQPMPESFTKGQPIAQLQGQELQLLRPASQRSASYGQSGQEISELLAAHRQHRRRHLHRPLDADRADQPRPGPHVHEHAARAISGRPSMGSWVTYGLGSESDDLPGFVVLTSLRRHAVAAADRLAAVAQRLPARPVPGRASSTRRATRCTTSATRRASTERGSSDVVDAVNELNRLRDAVERRTPRSPRASPSTSWRSACRRACRS